jgi:hypothetical protein
MIKLRVYDLPTVANFPNWYNMNCFGGNTLGTQLDPNLQLSENEPFRSEITNGIVVEEGQAIIIFH